MIYGIGTDIVQVARMQNNLEKYGNKFAEKILSATEFCEFQASSRPANLLAKRFAAKEAASKAFGTGFRNGLSLKDIAVTHDELGKPLLQLTNTAAQMAADLNIHASHISLSDEAEFVVAYVIFECS